jgi:hypothetical protein
MAIMLILLEIGVRKYEGSVSSSSMAFRPSLMKIHVKVVNSEDFMTAEVNEIIQGYQLCHLVRNE